MKYALIAAIFLVTTVVKVVAEPEPWLGYQTKKYCEEEIAHVRQPRMACRVLSNNIVEKLKNWCSSGAGWLCITSSGFQKWLKCKALVRSYICASLYGNPTHQGRRGSQSSLGKNLQKFCYDSLRGRNNVCEGLKNVVAENCQSKIEETCRKAALSIAEPSKGSSVGMMRLVSSSLLDTVCTSSITQSVYNRFCR